MAIDLNTLNTTPEGGMPPLIVIYGTEGIGKTTTALGAPNPIYLPTEARFGHLKVVNAFQTPEDPYRICGSFNEMIETLDWLINEPHDFKSVIIDGVDHFEPHVWDAVVAQYPYVEKGEPVDVGSPHGREAREIKQITDYPYSKGPKLALPAWRLLLSKIQLLKGRRGMVVIVLAHYMIKQEELADQDPFQQYQINIHKDAASLLRASADYILFAKLKQFTKRVGDKSGFSKDDTRKTQVAGDAQRVLICQPSGAYTVKTSSRDMPAELPLSWDAVAQHIPFFNKTEGK